MKNHWRVIALILTFGAVSVRSEAATKTLTELDRGEPFEAMSFHAGHLWVGQSRKQFGSNYRVQVFDRNDRPIAEVALVHAITFLYPYAADSVLAIGTAHSPNLTHFSILSLRAGKISTKTTAIPMHAWGHTWLGTLGDRELFTDFSGNSNDPATEKDFNLPAQTLFTVARSRQTKYLPLRIRAPFQSTRIGEQFYVLHLNGIGNPATHLVKVDPRAGKVTKLLAAPLNRALDVLALADGRHLAVSETGTNQVHLLEAASGKKVAAFESNLGPRSLANLGRCLLTGNETSRSVTVTDISRPQAPKVVAGLDFSGTGELFRGLRKIAVDPQTGRIYGRSAYACNPMGQDCSKLWNSVVVNDAGEGARVRKLCIE